MISARLISAWLACAAALASGAASSQPRTEPENNFKAIEPITEPAQVADWLQRMVGRYKYDGMIQVGDCAEMNTDEGGGPPPPPNDNCVAIKGKSDCIAVGKGPGVQCILNVTWLDIYATDFGNGTVEPVLVSYLDPAMELYGLEPRTLTMSRLIVNNKGIAESGPGYIKGNTASFWSPCANSDQVGCQRIVRIEARPGAKVIWVSFSTRVEPEPETTYATMTLRRVAPEQAVSMDDRLRDVISAADESEEEIARAREDAREEREALALEAPVNAAPALQHMGKEAPAVDTLDDVVAEGERERQRQAQRPRQILDPDSITVTRSSATTGNGSVRVQVHPYIPPGEIRFRSSDARQLADGVHPHIKLQPDRLTTDNGSVIRNVSLDFAAGMDEADGLPALIPFSATTSIFNIDYVRLRNSTQQQMVTLRNVMDPETRRCGSALRLGGGGEDFHDRFVLLGNRFGDCNGTVKSREGDLVFADAVSRRLRQELHDFYDPVYNRFTRDLGSEPGIVFVVWRPESPRNDFRFARSLNRTSLLVLNGPSWEHGFTAQQRDALWEEVVQEQILRRLGQGQPDAVTEAATDYLLKLVRAERQQTTSGMLTTEVPEWIAACARAMSLRVGATNSVRGVYNNDCGLVVQFVYDAVARANSKGEDSVMRTWRTLLADAFRRGKSGVQSSAFLDSSADARRIVQGLMNGVMDWNAFAVELGKVGVQLRVTPGQLAPSVQVESLANFRD